jgi:hypothetical protein
VSPDPGSRPDGPRLPRRATDRVEDAVALLLTVAALVLLVVAGLAGIAVHGEQAEAAREVTQSRAVLLEDAKVIITDELGRSMPTPVQARWIDRSGIVRTGDIVASISAPAGTEIDVWLAPDGEVSTTPLGRTPVLTGIVVAAAVLLAGTAILGAVWCGVRHVIAVCNARRWEREWARVGPEWSSRPL